jgi:hypothetical protein
MNLLYLKGDFNSTKKARKILLEAIYVHYAKTFTILSGHTGKILTAKIASDILLTITTPKASLRGYHQNEMLKNFYHKQDFINNKHRM